MADREPTTRGLAGKTRSSQPDEASEDEQVTRRARQPGAVASSDAHGRAGDTTAVPSATSPQEPLLPG
jgi:hypothetical protein